MAAVVCSRLGEPSGGSIWWSRACIVNKCPPWFVFRYCRAHLTEQGKCCEHALLGGRIEWQAQGKAGQRGCHSPSKSQSHDADGFGCHIARDAAEVEGSSCQCEEEGLHQALPQQQCLTAHPGADVVCASLCRRAGGEGWTPLLACGGRDLVAADMLCRQPGRQGQRFYAWPKREARSKEPGDCEWLPGEHNIISNGICPWLPSTRDSPMAATLP